MSYAPQHLKLWNCGREFASGFDSCDNYAGDSFGDRYVVVSKNRDSEILTEVNFQVALERLGGVSDLVSIVRIGHWACGWIEHLMVHQLAGDTLLEAADEIVADLRAYPILDEDAYSEAQDEAVYEYWKSMSMRERVDVCHDRGASAFAARRSEIPESVYDYLREQCP